MAHVTRIFEELLKKRLKEKPKFIQVILGPRQVGKTTGVLSVLKSHFANKDYLYLSAEGDLFEPQWLREQIQKAQLEKKKIIVIDEIQKVENWSEIIKAAWDAQKKNKKLIHWVLLGSSSLKLTQGLGDSLAGRFEVIPVPHWSARESFVGFKVNLKDYLRFGGYPASYELIDNSKRFRAYMTESIFESVVSRDILRYATIKKPALFKQTFMLACQHPAQEISYNKLLGQLQEAGNVDQVKHYLDLFCQAFLMRQIFKYSKSPLSRVSSPKILPCAPVFTELFLRRTLTAEELGRVFEAVVGQRLCENFETVYYWREAHAEVDYVVELEGELIAIEVKSQRNRPSGSGFTAFKKKFTNAKFCLIHFENYAEFEQDPATFLSNYSF